MHGNMTEDTCAIGCLGLTCSLVHHVTMREITSFDLDLAQDVGWQEPPRGKTADVQGLEGERAAVPPDHRRQVPGHGLPGDDSADRCLGVRAPQAHFGVVPFLQNVELVLVVQLGGVALVGLEVGQALDVGLALLRPCRPVCVPRRECPTVGLTRFTLCSTSGITAG